MSNTTASNNPNASKNLLQKILRDELLRAKDELYKIQKNQLTNLKSLSKLKTIPKIPSCEIELCTLANILALISKSPRTTLEQAVSATIKWCYDEKQRAKSRISVIETNMIHSQSYHTMSMLTVESRALKNTIVLLNNIADNATKKIKDISKKWQFYESGMNNVSLVSATKNSSLVRKKPSSEQNKVLSR